MDINGLINKFMGSDNKPNSNMGLAGGALAGGALALLMGSKNVRKLAGTAASVGGMALLGGMAAKAFQTWQSQGKGSGTAGLAATAQSILGSGSNQNEKFELGIIKAMVAAAKADGHIDSAEQEKIFKQASDYSLSAEEKALVFDLISKPISVQEICSAASTMEQKAELYLASRLACGGDSPDEQKYLSGLAEGLALPQDLVKQLDQQVAG